MFRQPDTVDRSGELRRIAGLPRRKDAPEGADQLTDVLRTPQGSQVLRPVQAQALAEMYCCRGLLGPIRVGAGKTLISYLAPRMVQAVRPLLLVPAKLRDKTRRDFDQLGDHWVPGVVPRIMSYEMLSQKQWADFLVDTNPDLIIADEAHRLKNPRAAVTRRVGRYMSQYPDTLFVALSGTMTKRSLMDFAHLSEWCLGDGSPLPRERFVLEQWSMCLDEDNQWDKRLAPGPLMDLHTTSPKIPEDWGPVSAGTIAGARRVFRRRFEETPGVVLAQGRGVEASIRIDKWQHGVKRNEDLATAFRVLRDYWETPDGRPLISAAEVWRHSVELSQGFWYRWEPEPPDEWLDARREWAAFAREVLSRSRSLDSEAQVADKHRDTPVFRQWDEVRDKYTPTTVTEWITQDYVKSAAQWARDTGGIVWVGHRAVGHAIEDLGVPYYGSMGRTSSGLSIDDATGGIAASIAANSEGRNLQHYNKNLILAPPTTGDRWEQMLGRTHREGQKADEVLVEVLLETKTNLDGFWQAVSDSEYQKQITGSEQKLLLADLTFAKGLNK